jgi:hypothetical protein
VSACPIEHLIRESGGALDSRGVLQAAKTLLIPIAIAVLISYSHGSAWRMRKYESPAMVPATAVRQSIRKISDTIWELPPTTKDSMRVPARIYATEKLLSESTG